MSIEENAIRDFWRENHEAQEVSHLPPFVRCPALVCADGFEMSVQASDFHYCSPKIYLPDGDYSDWEIGFPTLVEPLIIDWIEDAESPTETVYGYVPTSVINEVIAKHGGIVGAAAKRGRVA